MISISRKLAVSTNKLFLSIYPFLFLNPFLCLCPILCLSPFSLYPFLLLHPFLSICSFSYLLPHFLSLPPFSPFIPFLPSTSLLLPLFFYVHTLLNFPLAENPKDFVSFQDLVFLVKVTNIFLNKYIFLLPGTLFICCCSTYCILHFHLTCLASGHAFSIAFLKFFTCAESDLSFLVDRNIFQTSQHSFADFYIICAITFSFPYFLTIIAF
jgi:hypothetical protein